MAYNFNQLNVKEKIGVGTETPSEALEIKGNIKLNSGVAVSEFSSDGTLAIVNDRSVPTTQAVKTYVDKQISTTNAAFASNINTQIATVNTTLASKANKGGSSTQDFQTNNLKVQGNFEVTGTTTFRNIEQHQGDVELGNEDSDRVKIHGVLESTHSSNALQINSPLNVTSSLNVNGNGNINNTFLGDVGHTDGWAGFSHRGSVSTVGYALLQSNDGIYTLLNKKSGGGYMGFRVDNVDKMVINDLGNVGIGMTIPDARLTVHCETQSSVNNTAVFHAPNIGPNHSHIHWGTTGDWYIRSASSTGKVILQDSGGEVLIFNGRFVSSREYKENIAELSTQEATIALKDLNPVKFSYKTDRAENIHVGFIAEDVPDLLAAHDKKSIGSLDVIAVLTKVAQDQQSTIASLIDRLNVLEAKQA
jgi:Chaperone of endosialidase